MSEVRSEIEAIITDFVKRLENRGIRVERVYRSGSYLKGMADEWSDIDLLVVSEDADVLKDAVVVYDRTLARVYGFPLAWE